MHYQKHKNLGYAEADPYNDVSGQDAFKKLMILSALAFGEQPDWADVEVIGIDSISAEQVKEANEKGLRYRHVAEVEKLVDGKVVAKVGPLLVDKEHPLYPVDDVINAVAMEYQLYRHIINHRTRCRYVSNSQCYGRGLCRNYRQTCRLLRNNLRKNSHAFRFANFSF